MTSPLLAVNFIESKHLLKSELLMCNIELDSLSCEDLMCKVIGLLLQRQCKVIR